MKIAEIALIKNTKEVRAGRAVFTIPSIQSNTKETQLNLT